MYDKIHYKKKKRVIIITTITAKKKKKKYHFGRKCVGLKVGKSANRILPVDSYMSLHLCMQL